MEILSDTGILLRCHNIVVLLHKDGCTLGLCAIVMFQIGDKMDKVAYQEYLSKFAEFRKENLHPSSSLISLDEYLM